MRNIWIPHIEKTGGMTLVHSLEKTNLLFYKEDIFQIYHNNGHYLHIHHDNPFKKGMENWLKILIIREPVSRFISAFNFQKWRVWFRYKEVDTRTIEEFMNSYEHKSHIECLNTPSNDIIFSFDNIKNIFDYIIDISELHKVFTLIENNFLGFSIEWKNHNTSERNIKGLNKSAGINYKVLKKEDLNEDQLNKLKILLKDDIEFYEFVL